MAAEMVSEARATLRELRATQPNRGLVNILDMDMWGERERERGRDRETVTRAPDGGLAAVGVCAASCDGHCISCLDSLGLFFFCIILFMN